MKARPILFSAPMIRALLAGRKRQTRRIVKPQPEWRCVAGAFQSWVFPRAERGVAGLLWPNARDQVLTLSPYGQPGDLLWCRESWSGYLGAYGEEIHYAYRATDDERLGPWKPSIHMPRRASRLTLRITDVRAERLQEISCADAIAEGCHAVSLHDLDCDSPDPRDEYRTLWESINGIGSWEANPWVWTISFSVIKQNVDTVLKAAA